MNNLEFMKHLHLHVEKDRDEAIDMVDLSQCRYCYRDFDSEEKANSHVDLEHLKAGQEFVCQICTTCYPAKNHLIHHMLKVHMKNEMPYKCRVCGYRTSLHRDMVEHFHMNHDRTDKLQCPQCLQTFSLYSDKGYNSTTSDCFLKHLQRHEDIRKKQNLHCKKCSLKFLDERQVKSHLAEDHVSFKDFDNVEAYEFETEGMFKTRELPCNILYSSGEPIQIPLPDERGMKVATKKTSVVKVYSYLLGVPKRR